MLQVTDLKKYAEGVNQKVADLNDALKECQVGGAGGHLRPFLYPPAFRLPFSAPAARVFLVSALRRTLPFKRAGLVGRRVGEPEACEAGKWRPAWPSLVYSLDSSWEGASAPRL